MRAVREIGVPSFPTVDAALKAIDNKAHNRPENLYPRDGNIFLSQQEARVADIVGIERDNLLLYPNGMRALQEAVELTHPRIGTTIVYGDQLYSQSGWYLGTELQDRGVRTVTVDAGSPSRIAQAIERHRPSVLVFETVANAPDMSVLPLKELLALQIVDDVNPFIILDNTLPTATYLSPRKTLGRTDRRVLVVESGTKYFGLNQEMCGLIYSNNEELIQQLRARKPRTGSTPSDAAVQRLERLIPPSQEEFTKRVRQTTQNTFRLAKACANAEGDFFTVTYPNLSTHPNFFDATKRFPEGAAPLFFIHATQLLSQIDILRALWNDQRINKFCKIGQSFGFNNTRLWPDSNVPILRVAGGTESVIEIEELENAFFETLSLLHR